MTESSLTASPLPFESFRDNIYHHLLKKFERVNEEDKRFAPAGTAAAVLQPNVLEQFFAYVEQSCDCAFAIATTSLVERVRQRRLHTYLAVLLYSSRDIRAARSFTKSLVAVDTWPVKNKREKEEIDLAALPAKREDIEVVLGSPVEADQFWKNQAHFCTVVLEGGQEVVKSEQHRLPYLQEKKIGEGSFGTVFKVTIAPGHFQKDSMQNNTPKEMARKDYVLAETHDNSLDIERKLMRDLLRNTKKSINVLENLGSLQIGLTYSLFMPLAESDLRDYMMEKQRATPSMDMKAKIIHSCAGLAGGLAFLHDELKTDDFDRLSCYHMDLKPKNILVFLEDGVTRWKLSDFNMSRVKAKPKPSQGTSRLDRTRSRFAEIRDYDFNKVFTRRSDPTGTSNAEYTANCRDGTYLAPEKNMKAESDTWSLGCVISVVFSYLDGGAEAVDEYGDLRGEIPKGRLDDTFFSPPSGYKPLRRSEGVNNWHVNLRIRAKKRSPAEGMLVHDMLTFLEKKVLVADIEKGPRAKAHEVEQKLEEIYKGYKGLSESTPTLLPSPLIPRPNLLRRRPTNDQLGVRSWNISPILPITEIKGCEFSPKSEVLVYWSKTTIKVFSTLGLCETANIDQLLPLGDDSTLESKNSTWKSVAVSNGYVVATTDQPYFDCYIFSTTNPSRDVGEVELKKRASLAELPPVWKVAISPDNQYLACILRDPNSERDLGSLLHVKMEELLNYLDASPTGSNSLPTQPWVIWSLDNPPFDFTHFVFSENNDLYAVLQPGQSFHMTQHKVTILVWYFNSKTRDSMVVEADGRQDATDTLFTSFSPFHGQHGCAVISRKKHLIVQILGKRGAKAKSAFAYSLLRPIMSWEDDRIFCFGAEQAMNDLRLFTFPTHTQDEKLNIELIAKLPKMKKDNTKFAAGLFRSSALGEEYMVIATLSGQILQVRIP